MFPKAANRVKGGRTLYLVHRGQTKSLEALGMNEKKDLILAFLIRENFISHDS